MKIIQQSSEILTDLNTITPQFIEKIGRVCYKSENYIKDYTAENFIKNLIKRGHESVLEHLAISVKFVCDRSVSHQIVRHRIASFSQESQRYCNYSKGKFGNEITFIEPVGIDNKHQGYVSWFDAMVEAEKHYFEIIKLGVKPEEARKVLPNSTKTEIIMTTNLREWRHFFKLRADYHADLQTRTLCLKLLEKMPSVFFDDIKEYFEIEL